MTFVLLDCFCHETSDDPAISYTQGVGSNAQQRGMRVGARDAYDYLREEGVVNRRKEELKNGSCLDQERGRPLSFAALFRRSRVDYL